ncbi:MAG TPA: hypothetical protein PLX80_06305, partial [Ignavibacteria bacterium]|nr:hypothetical protein [Ignavibacteria bacterium]
MKRNLLITIFICFIFNVSPLRSQTPQYTLEVKNLTWSPGVNQFGGSTLQFDLVFTHTDATVMQLAGWQFFFKLPQTA